MEEEACHKNRPPQGWREKLGIETTQDLLIFCIIVGVTCGVLAILVYAVLAIPPILPLYP